VDAGGAPVHRSGVEVIVLFALGGAVLGFAADRLSARWPSHRPTDADAAPALAPHADAAPAPALDPTQTPAPHPTRAAAATVARRGLDWRTATMVLVGAIAFGALAARWTEPRDLAILGLYFAALVVLMATDLDQRLLPDLITLPMIPIALVLLVAGLDPLVQGKELGIVSGIAAGIGAPILLIATNVVLRGGLGVGDLKLAVSLGLMSGVSRFVVGFLIASAASSIILIALLASRRIGRRSAIPFGPVLIGAGLIAAFIG
jgi:leader peptidase (prepilin peptidase)/N-methyltransferase